ncbi:MAG: NADH-quinone oxidoreductase subunit M [Gammaproteobacteria bacterium]|nr:NADH-quinone oxidoreductase subunit M [Gammaproteobacteria bacterium]
MLLILLILTPFIGGLLCWQIERFGENFPRWIALLCMTSVTVISVLLWLQGDYNLAAISGAATQSQWQLEYQIPWITRFGISIHLGLDGLSLLLVMLTGFIGALSVACSWNEVQKYVGFFHLNLLWILGGVIGVFLALDLFLFFFFWEMMLVPMYFLIALWGHSGSDGKSRITAATKFFIYTQASGLLMLLAILGLVFAHYQSTNILSFDYDVLRHAVLSPALEFVLMLGFFIAFAVKLPVVPLHSWLPDAHAQAPTAGSVDLAGLLLKTAAYGLLRFVLPIFPHASQEFAPIAMTLGAIGIIYGAVLAFAQTDIKRLIAYTSISHMGFVLIAIYAGTLIALQGAVVQMVAHGISAAALFILCGQVYERLHTRNLNEMGGLWSRLPLLPAFALFFSAASLGLPGTGNFVGEFLILLGAYDAAPIIVIIAASGLVLASIYSLTLMQRAFYGPAKTDEPIRGPSLREFLMSFALVLLLLYIGLYPQPLLDTSASVMQSIQQAYLPVSIE